MKEYKNLIFDIGNVLLSYQFDINLRKIGVSKEDALRVDEEVFDSGYWIPLDRGDLSLEEVTDLCCEKYPDDAYNIRYLLTHLENMSIPRKGVWDCIHKLKEKGYKLYIISNYSEKLLKAHSDGASFWEDMDGVVISYLERCVKPEPQIYLCLLDRYNLKAEECLFFDDRQDNVEGARAVGIDAIQIESEEHIYNELLKLL